MPELATVAEALAHARALGVDRLDAQLLLAHSLGCARTWLVSHDDAPICSEALEAVAALWTRRAAGEPLAYLVGEREFRGLRLRVTRDVLVPRPDSETLVDWALELLADVQAPCIADLGTGSGAIALALKQGCARAQVHASDISPAALAVARDNGQRLTLPVSWYEGDWWQALSASPDIRFDMIVANPPYIAPGDPHLAALQHEPLHALVPRADAGDGLTDIERIVRGAPAWLRPAGWLLLEHAFDQADAVRQRLRLAGFECVATRTDLAGQPRVSGGRRGAAVG